MLRRFWLAFAFAALAITITPANAQSDCGNCYVAGQSCTVNEECGDIYSFVTVIVQCDYAPCGYTSSYCGECPVGFTQQSQKESHAKIVLARIRRRNAERTKRA